MMFRSIGRLAESSLDALGGTSQKAFQMMLLTAAEARAFEARVRERLSVTERDLIARAGLAAFQSLGRFCGAAAGLKVAVFFGRGNNAADGLVLAAELVRGGAVVAVVPAFEATALAPEAAHALREALRAGATLGPLERASEILRDSNVAVDALVGTGAHLPLTGPLETLAGALERFEGRVLALDLPSGLDPDSGEVRGVCVRATWTLSFLAAKLGSALGEGPRRCGCLEVAGLGTDETWADSRTRLFDAGAARGALLPRPWDYHKRKAGLLVVAGSRDYLGAALLCARAAYRCGAGFVRLALPEPLVSFAQAALPEAVVSGLPVDDADAEVRQEILLRLASQVQAAVVGPGLGRGPGTPELVRFLWRRLPVPTIFDADALHALASGDGAASARILTPHEGELKAMLGDGVLDLGRVDAVRRLAESFAAVALLKGPSTLVAGPDGALTVNSGATAALATAGTGDVLSGAIGALLAQGHAAFEAAALGAWIQGRSARRWSRSNGARGMLASDLCEGLPGALAELEGGAGI